MSSVERKELLDERKAVTKAIKTTETQAMKIVPTNFATLLENILKSISVHDTNTAGGMVHFVQQAYFQTDSLINQLYVDGKIDLVMSTDVDYPVQNGDECVAIKPFIGCNVTLVSKCKQTMEAVMKDFMDVTQSEVEL